MQSFLRIILFSFGFTMFSAHAFTFEIKDPFIEFSADDIKEIEIDYIYSDGKIATHAEGSKSTVKVHGRKEALDSIEIDKHGHDIKINYKKSVISQTNHKVYIEINTPQTTDLELSIIDGDWTVGTAHGDVKLEAFGSGSFTFSELVSDKVELSLNGAASIDIEIGSIDDLEAKVIGNGLINFGGTAKKAGLQVIGSGQININNISDKVSNNAVFGSGRVKIASLPTLPAAKVE